MTLPFDNPTLRSLWDYWQSLRAGRLAPLAGDVSLAALGPASDYLLLLERDGQRFRYLSVGAAIRRIYGYPMEGLYLDAALPPSRRDQAIARYSMVCNSGRPLLTRNAYEISKALSFLVERLFVPLARADGTVTSVLCAQVMRRPVDGAMGPATESRPADDQVIFLDADPPPPRDLRAG